MRKPWIPLYLINLLRDINLVGAIISPLMISNNLSLSEIVMVLGVFRITQLVFSIPIGVFADKYGSKLSLYLVGLSYFASFLVLTPEKISAVNFALFNFLNGISACFLVSSSTRILKQMEPDPDLFSGRYAFKLSLRKLGIVVSCAISSVLIVFADFKSILLAQMLIAAGAIVVIRKVDFSYDYKNTDSGVFDNLVLGIREAPYRLMFRVLVASLSFFISLDIFMVPLLVDLDVPKWNYPLVFSVCNLLVFLSMNNAKSVSKIIPSNIVIETFAPLAPLILFVIFKDPILAIASFSITVFCRSFSVIENSRFINQTDPKQRGTNDAILNTLTFSAIALFNSLFASCLNSYSLHASSIILLASLIVFLTMGLVLVHYGPKLKSIQASSVKN